MADTAAAAAQPAAAAADDDFDWAVDDDDKQPQAAAAAVPAAAAAAVKQGPIPFKQQPTPHKQAAGAVKPPAASAQQPRSKPALVAPPAAPGTIKTSAGGPAGAPAAPGKASPAGGGDAAASAKAAAPAASSSPSSAAPAAATAPAAAPAAPAAVVDNPPSSSSSKGWGTWLAPSNLGGLSSKLQQVALGAAKDLQELTASVQQAVAEAVAAEDITEVERLAEYQARPVGGRQSTQSTQQQQQQGTGGGGDGDGQQQQGSVTPPGPVPVPVRANRDSSSSQLASKGVPEGAAAAAGTGSTTTAASAGSDPDEEARRLVLQRLQGKDTQLESGLKVIDDQVDALAANAAKALGSLWGGLSGVAKTISTKVEAAAKEVAKEVAVGLEEGASLVARAERGLESVLGPRISSGGGSHRSAAEWESTFESCFELFGGTTATEELEELSSECAHICNSARAKLQQQQREQIDAMLTRLVPLFDPSTIVTQTQEGEGQQQPDSSSKTPSAAAAVADNDEADEATQDALDALYAPVVALCNKGKKKAAQLQETAAEAVAAVTVAAAAGSPAADSAASPQPQSPQPQSPQQAAEAAAAGDDGAGSDADQQRQRRLAVALEKSLQGVRTAAVKSLSEVAAGQIMVLLTMGRSIAALPRYGKPLADGLEWPSDAEAVAGLMRGQVQHMAADTREVAAAFAAATAAVAAHMPADGAGAEAEAGEAVPLPPDQQLRERAAGAASEVESDSQLALSHVRDSFGKLLYVVLLASLHRAGKEEKEGGGEEAQAVAV